MKEDYRKIRKELFRISPRFKKRLAKIYLRFFLKVALAEALVGAFTVGVYVITPGGALAFPIIGVIVFWILFKQSILNKKPLVGTVTTIGRDNRLVASDANIRRMMSKNFSIFTVTRPDGRKEEIALPVPYERVFKKGDKLIRLTGMDYPVDLTPEELLICPFCGNIFPTENKVCIECNEPALNDTAIGEISF